MRGCGNCWINNLTGLLKSLPTRLAQTVRLICMVEPCQCTVSSQPRCFKEKEWKISHSQLWSIRQGAVSTPNHLSSFCSWSSMSANDLFTLYHDKVGRNWTDMLFRGKWGGGAPCKWECLSKVCMLFYLTKSFIKHLCCACKSRGCWRTWLTLSGAGPVVEAISRPKLSRFINSLRRRGYAMNNA